MAGMVSWHRKSELIHGHDPKSLNTALEALENSEGWQFVIEAISDEMANLKEKVFNTIEGSKNANGKTKEQVLDDHNRNVVTIKTLECVFGLPRDARAKCDEGLKKGR